MLASEMATRRLKARAALVASALALTTTACHCNDECRSAAQCASGICHDGYCLDPMDTPDAGGTSSPAATTADGG